MVTAKDIADYFLSGVDSEAGDSLSNLKLQKLVYYGQGYHLALYDKPLFLEDIQAWEHGPVVPGLYRLYKQYGAGPIPAPECESFTEVLSAEQVELLEEIKEVYGQFSAWKLRDMTHMERPWLDAYNLAPSSVITHDALKSFFKTLVNEKQEA